MLLPARAAMALVSVATDHGRWPAAAAGSSFGIKCGRHEVVQEKPGTRNVPASEAAIVVSASPVSRVLLSAIAACHLVWLEQECHKLTLAASSQASFNVVMMRFPFEALISTHANSIFCRDLPRSPGPSQRGLFSSETFVTLWMENCHVSIKRHPNWVARNQA